eukprot:GGOE01042892.1.p1 GENE.GGOE01042892.1~~GGOE01042892.1.p1  ORF type:complete len:498 (+),score=87.53 GGOE01042892.1:133-1626(+)
MRASSSTTAFLLIVGAFFIWICLSMGSNSTEDLGPIARPGVQSSSTVETQWVSQSDLGARDADIEFLNMVGWMVPSNSGAEAPLHLIQETAWMKLQTTIAEDARRSVYSMHDIIQNQFRTDCADRMMLIYSIHTSMGTFGIFSVINQLLAALSAALYLNRTLYFHTSDDYPWKFADPVECRDALGRYQPWNCYFEPITNCDLPRIKGFGRPIAIWLHRISDLTGRFGKVQQFATDAVYAQKLFFGLLSQNPPLETDFLRHNAPLVTFLFRPVQRILLYKRRLKLRLQLGSYASVHIRGTDKLLEEEWIAQRLEEKEEAQLTLKERKFYRQRKRRASPAPPRTVLDRWRGCLAAVGHSSPQTIFLMTDQQTLLDRVCPNATGTCTVRLGDKTLEVKTSPQLRPPEGVTVTLKHAEASNSTAFPIVRHVVEFLSDALIAAESEHFVGTCGSNVDWFVAQLAAIHHRTLFVNASYTLTDQFLCRYWAEQWPTDKSFFKGK